MATFGQAIQERTNQQVNSINSSYNNNRNVINPIKPDTAQSTAEAKYVVHISEGPIEGLIGYSGDVLSRFGEGALKSLYLDKGAVTTNDGFLINSGINIVWKDGDINDNSIFSNFSTSTLFNSVQTTIGGIDLVNSWASNEIGSAISKVRIALGTQALYDLDPDESTDEGTYAAVRMPYTVLTGETLASLQEYDTTYIETVALSPFLWDIDIELPTGVSKYVSIQRNGNLRIIRENDYRNNDPSVYLQNRDWPPNTLTQGEQDNGEQTRANLFIQSYSEINENNFLNPGSALAGVSISAESFNSIPETSFRIRGKKVKVPSGYNGPLRNIDFYDNVWDGTFDSELRYTNNPVWILYDILTNSEIGLGNYIEEGAVDKWSLYEIARFCDERVNAGYGSFNFQPKTEGSFSISNDPENPTTLPLIGKANGEYNGTDGYLNLNNNKKLHADQRVFFTSGETHGGLFPSTGEFFLADDHYEGEEELRVYALSDAPITFGVGYNPDIRFTGTYLEPRYSFNGVLNSEQEAIAAIRNIALNFKSMIYWNGGAIAFNADGPKDAKAIFTNSDVKNGEFHYQGSSKKTRFSVAHVTYNDENDFFRPKIEYVEDPIALLKYGYKPFDTVAFGTTSRSQAWRHGKWFLTTQNNETQTVQFSAGINNSALLPGDVIKVLDKNKQGREYGGRLFSIDSSNGRVTLDRDVFISGNQNYSLSIFDPETFLDNSELTQISGKSNINTSTLSEFHVELTGDDVRLRSLTLTGNNLNRLSGIEPNFSWVLESSTVLEAQQFRVIQISENESEYDVVAVQYDPNKFSAIENNLVLPPLKINSLPDPKETLPPTNLRASIVPVSNGEYRANISWTKPEGIFVDHYDVRWKRGLASGRWTNSQSIYEPRFSFPFDPRAGEHTFAVSTVSSSNNHSSFQYITVGSDKITGNFEHLQAPPNEKRQYKITNVFCLNSGKNHLEFQGSDLSLKITNNGITGDSTRDSIELARKFSFVDYKVVLTSTDYQNSYTINSKNSNILVSNDEFFANLGGERNFYVSAKARYIYHEGVDDFSFFFGNEYLTTINNPAPIIPTGIEVIGNQANIVLKFSPDSGNDWQGNMVWLEDDNGLIDTNRTPDLKGSDNYYVLNINQAGKKARIASYDSFGVRNLNISPIIDLSDTTPPNKIEEFSANRILDTVEFSWKASSNLDIKSYEIYEQSGSTPNQITSIDSTKLYNQGEPLLYPHSKKIGEILHPSNSFQYKVDNTYTRNYWIRGVDWQGNKSKFAPFFDSGFQVKPSTAIPPDPTFLGGSGTAGIFNIEWENPTSDFIAKTEIWTPTDYSFRNGPVISGTSKIDGGLKKFIPTIVEFPFSSNEIYKNDKTGSLLYVQEGIFYTIYVISTQSDSPQSIVAADFYDFIHHYTQPVRIDNTSENINLNYSIDREDNQNIDFYYKVGEISYPSTNASIPVPHSASGGYGTFLIRNVDKYGNRGNFYPFVWSGVNINKNIDIPILIEEVYKISGEMLQNSGDITETKTLLITTGNVFTQDILQLNSDLVNSGQQLNANITETNTALVGASGVLAQSTSNLQAQYNESSGKVDIMAEVLITGNNEVISFWATELDANGNTAGLKLINKDVNGIGDSRFIVNADQFAIGTGKNPPFEIRLINENEAALKIRGEIIVENQSVDTEVLPVRIIPSFSGFDKNEGVYVYPYSETPITEYFYVTGDNSVNILNNPIKYNPNLIDSRTAFSGIQTADSWGVSFEPHRANGFQNEYGPNGLPNAVKLTGYSRTGLINVNLGFFSTADDLSNFDRSYRYSLLPTGTYFTFSFYSKGVLTTNTDTEENKWKVYIKEQNEPSFGGNVEIGHKVIYPDYNNWVRNTITVQRTKETNGGYVVGLIYTGNDSPEFPKEDQQILVWGPQFEVGKYASSYQGAANDDYIKSPHGAGGLHFTGGDFTFKVYGKKGGETSMVSVKNYYSGNFLYEPLFTPFFTETWFSTSKDYISFGVGTYPDEYHFRWGTGTALDINNIYWDAWKFVKSGDIPLNVGKQYIHWQQTGDIGENSGQFLVEKFPWF